MLDTKLFYNNCLVITAIWNKNVKKSFHLYLNEHILCALTIEFLLEEKNSLCQKLVKFD